LRFPRLRNAETQVFLLNEFFQQNTTSKRRLPVSGVKRSSPKPHTLCITFQLVAEDAHPLKQPVSMNVRGTGGLVMRAARA
jgi:hypothetical protein